MIQELFWGQSSSHAGSSQTQVGVGTCGRQHGVIELPTEFPAGLGPHCVGWCRPVVSKELLAAIEGHVHFGRMGQA